MFHLEEGVKEQRNSKSNNFGKRKVKMFLGEAMNNLMKRDFKHKNKVQQIVRGLVGNDDELVMVQTVATTAEERQMRL
ncbi:hypothetical protein H5410_061011 [Solanum commersonii]|uniref:Uncharacterized protein n=1 Tax=Solanum commersonii TaxID=4109 RepID=A0A9J5W6K5_SOLCO|nr:hypothetical protein H5410_061011 [Solanum commersonii]